MALLAAHKAVEDARQAVIKYSKRRARLRAQLDEFEHARDVAQLADAIKVEPYNPRTCDTLD
jgi:hypothetical protein